ncbi:hypothetical protein [Rhabdaerophilum sp.]|uniref:hypothetical protein n=1 Tax=Rhabdaerophilum sp. TaxID=2717341 RepID=UPI0038D3F408
MSRARPRPTLVLTDDDRERLKSAYLAGAEDNSMLESWGQDTTLYRELKNFEAAWQRLSDEAKAWLVDDTEKDALWSGEIAEFSIEGRLEEAFKLLEGIDGAHPNYAHRRVAHELREIWTREGLRPFAVAGRLVPEKRLGSEQQSGSSSIRNPNAFVSQLAQLLLELEPALESEHRAKLKAHTAVLGLGKPML